jgi:hypothetical protein
VSWVDDEFKERIAINSGTIALWNAMRDSIGLAVSEYNRRVAETDSQLSRSDCSAKSRFCVRVEMKRKDRFIEIFVEENEPVLNVGSQAEQESREICRYRVNADRSGLELYLKKPDQTTSTITPEEACKLALHDFLFKPFPVPFANC